MDLYSKQYARVNVKTIQSNGTERALNRSFSVDPRTITLDRLLHLVARALDIREEFSILFMRSQEEASVPLSCDWDLEGALAEEPCLDLTLKLKPTEPELEEWDIICPADVPVAGHEASSYPPIKRKESLLEQVFQLYPLSPNNPLTESEFRDLSDWPCPLRYATFRAGGADATIRPSLWMHLLDVFPSGAGYKEREDFLNQKSEEYYGLRHTWQKLVQAGTIPNVLRDVSNLVRKDVRRTDRTQSLNEHFLYNVLTTYAVHHPSVGYCQGMSDLLSPLLHVMKTEARAYIALCGLMLRMRSNFRNDGRSICAKFRHLRRAIRAHDPQLYEHLSNVGALDLLFCYRWLLLDLKREFPYEDMLKLMEVMWSSMPPIHSERGVEMYEVRFPTTSVYEWLREKFEPKNLLLFEDNHFGTPKKTICQSLKRWALLSRRISIAKNIESEEDTSSDEDDDKSIIHYKRWRRRTSKSICNSWSGRDTAENHHGLCHANTVHDIQINNWINDQSPRKRHGSSDSNYGSTLSDEEPSEDESPNSRSEGYMSEQDSHQTLSDQSHSDSDRDFSRNDSLDSFTSADTYFMDKGHTSLLLPPPSRLCDGKPFLLFLCLTMILKHREVILAQRLDGNEIGIYFDKLVRKHKLSDILPKAKEMFEKYLITGWTEDD